MINRLLDFVLNIVAFQMLPSYKWHCLAQISKDKNAFIQWSRLPAFILFRNINVH